MSNPSLTESNFDWPFYVVFVYRKSIHIDGVGRRSIQYVLEHPPKYIDDMLHDYITYYIIIIWYTEKMFSVKLLVRGERFCVVGGGGGGGKTA